MLPKVKVVKYMYMYMQMNKFGCLVQIADKTLSTTFCPNNFTTFGNK